MVRTEIRASIFRGSTHAETRHSVHEGEAGELCRDGGRARQPQVLMRSRFRFRHSPMPSNRGSRLVAHRLSSSRLVS